MEFLARGAGQRVEGRIEGKVGREDLAHDDLGRGEEDVGCRVGVETAGEVAVIRGDDGVLGSLDYVRLFA